MLRVTTSRHDLLKMAIRLKMLGLFFLTVILSSTIADMEETAVVHVSQGDLKGLKVKTEAGATYYSFRAIPYAKPPVGPLRFKPPQPAESWEGIRDAIEIAPVCPQFGFFNHLYEGTEDCLYLNVFTTELPSGDSPSLKPVFAYIHGGGYFLGSGNNEMHGPARFMDNGEVVLVTMNYRLGALGFLSTGDSVVSGNNGLKDQVLSLRWIQDNIAKFGGDPNNVIIAGVSAGGSSTHLHLFSSLSKGLFHKAIAQSGSALAPWSAKTPAQARNKAFRLGETLGKKTNSSEELVEFLNTFSSKMLIEGTNQALEEYEKHPLPLPFLPVVERNDDPESTFLSEKPLTLTKENKFNKAPFIIGTTSREGLIIVGDLLANSSWYESLDEDLEPLFDVNLDFEKGTTQSKELTAKIRKYFFGDRPISNETWGGLVDIYGDVLFNIWAEKAAIEQTKVSDSPLYVYKLSFVGNSSFVPSALNLSGTGHGGDISLLFETSYGAFSKKQLEGEENIVSEKVIKMWVNFAKTGNPTPEKDEFLGVTWTPFTKSDAKFLDIDKELSMQDDYFKDRMQFWNNLLPEETA